MVVVVVVVYRHIIDIVKIHIVDIDREYIEELTHTHSPTVLKPHEDNKK